MERQAIAIGNAEALHKAGQSLLNPEPGNPQAGGRIEWTGREVRS